MSKAENNIFKVENGKENPFITMTGYIGGWRVNSESLFNAIKKMEKDGVTDCDLLINCAGGSTIDGFTIGEFMEASPIKFHGIVTGLAASMAAILLQFCDTRSSYKYGRLMTHKAKGYIRGESEQIRSYADLVEQEDEKIVSKLIERTGQSKKLVNGWLKSGIDKWFNATNAKSSKLIDSIINNTKPAPAVAENATAEEMVNTYGAVFNSIVEEYTEEETPPEAPKNTNPDNTHMKTRILAMLGTAAMANGLTENSNDEAFFAELQNVIDSAKNADKAVNELKTFKEAQAKVLIENAVKAGKLTAAEKEQWQKDAVENYTVVATAVGRMSGKVDPNAGLQKDPPKPGDPNQPEALKGREDWDHDKWMTEDPKGYQRLEASHPEAYDKIFNAHFNPEA